MSENILAIDQGTSNTKALLVGPSGDVLARASQPTPIAYPQAGWVEQDARELYQSSLTVVRKVLQKAGVPASRLKCIGITNQRETTIVWDRHTGEPVTNAIVWQCRRTAQLCEELKERGMSQPITEKTGLIIDAYFMLFF